MINASSSREQPSSIADNPAICGDWPDLALVSSDQHVICVHRHRISCTSHNAFAGLLADSKASAVFLPEPSSVLEVIVAVLYDVPAVSCVPSLETTEAALAALTKYGIPPHLHAFPGKLLYQLLLLHAPYRPIEAYALAGRYRLECAAVAISGHLLAYDTSQLSDDLAVKMSTVYFRRLFDLHHDRLSALKSIVFRPPAEHEPTPQCGEQSGSRARLKEGWAFAVAQLAWDKMPSESFSLAAGTTGA